MWPNLSVEPIRVHAEIPGRVPESYESGKNGLAHGGSIAERDCSHTVIRPCQFGPRPLEIR